METIPNEVLKVLALKIYKRCVGLEEYKEIKNTIDKYPQYFKWEHIYKNIPEEFHNKYETEERILFLSFYPPKESNRKEGEGIWSWIRRQEPAPSKITARDLQEVVEHVFVTAPKIKKEYEAAKIKLWNKHYKKYKLKYRE